MVINAIIASCARMFVAFAGMPHLETPVESPGRVFQLRIYESPSV